MVNWSAPAPFPGSLGVALAPKVLQADIERYGYEHSSATRRCGGTDEHGAEHDDGNDA
jgi:hypothetical protein